VYIHVYILAKHSIFLQVFEFRVWNIQVFEFRVENTCATKNQHTFMPLNGLVFRFSFKVLGFRVVSFGRI